MMSFFMGLQRLYLETGTANLQAMLRGSGKLSPDEVLMMSFEGLWNSSEKDLNIYRREKLEQHISW